MSKRYKCATSFANSHIDFLVKKGEVFGVLGPNGAGKTTLVRQICGTLLPSTGDILFEEMSIVKNPELINKSFATLNQVMFAQRSLTVFEFIYYTGVYRNLFTKTAKDQADYFLDYFDMFHIRNQLIDNLSGGEKRVVGFIAAVIGFRPLIILDEPTNDVDPKRRIKLWKLIRLLRDELGVTFLLVTHNIHEAQDVVDRVVIINNGQVVAIGQPCDIINSVKANVKLEFELPYYVNIPAWIAEIDGYNEVNAEKHQIVINPKIAKELFAKIVNSEIGPDLKSLEMITPSLEDAYLIKIDK